MPLIMNINTNVRFPATSYSDTENTEKLNLPTAATAINNPDMDPFILGKYEKFQSVFSEISK